MGVCIKVRLLVFADIAKFGFVFAHQSITKPHQSESSKNAGNQLGEPGTFATFIGLLEGPLRADIDEIDDVNQIFNVDLFVFARWQDPRLALSVKLNLLQPGLVTWLVFYCMPGLPQKPMNERNWNACAVTLLDHRYLQSACQ